MDDKKLTLRINSKKQTGFGTASILLGVASFTTFVIAACLSAFSTSAFVVQSHGVGWLEIVAVAFCIVGIVMAAIGEQTVETFKTVAHIGLVVNVALFILHLWVLIHGYMS